MTTKRQESPPVSEARGQSDYLNINELIDYLPSQPAKPTIYRLVQTKRIPCFRINGKLLFKRGEVDAWVESKRIKMEGGLLS